MTLLGTLVFVLDILAIVSLLAGYGSVSNKVFWIFMILLLPFLGMILYYLFGRSPVDA
jgi:hypothetical protein